MERENKVYLVSRHSGTVHWIERQNFQVHAVIEHLEIGLIESGDTVIGTLPIQMAADVCKRRAIYRHLSLDVPQPWRGRDLSAEEVSQCNPRLERFDICMVEE